MVCRHLGNAHLANGHLANGHLANKCMGDIWPTDKMSHFNNSFIQFNNRISSIQRAVSDGNITKMWKESKEKFGQNCLLAKCPPMHLLSKCPLAKCPLAKCPLAKWALAKCPLTKCPLAKCPLTKCPLAKCPLAKWALVKCPGFLFNCYFIIQLSLPFSIVEIKKFLLIFDI